MNLGIIDMVITLDSGILAANKHVAINTSSGGTARLYTATGKLISITGETTTDAAGKLRVCVPKNAEYSIFVRSKPTQKIPLYSKYNIVPLPIIDIISAEAIVAAPVIVPPPPPTSTPPAPANNIPSTSTVGKLIKGTASVVPIEIDLADNNISGVSLWIKLVPDLNCALRMEFSSDNRTNWQIVENSATRSATYQYTAAAGEPWITHIRILQISGASSNISTWAIWP